jgi:hypothetical protein
MEETATSSPENKRYNAELSLLEGLYEFHPNFFDGLNPKEQAALKAYYLIGSETPENIFSYRSDLVRRNPFAAEQAQATYQKILDQAGIKP